MKMPVAVRDKIRETSSVDFSRNLISHNHVANVMEQELDDKDRESRKFSTATTNGMNIFDISISIAPYLYSFNYLALLILIFYFV